MTIPETFHYGALFFALIAILLASSLGAVNRVAADPETVLITYQVKAGMEKDFEKLLSKHWPTLLRLKLVEPRPHLILRGEDDSHKPFFVEVLTWKNHDIPDNVPPLVQEIWDAMHPLVEEGLGQGGIEFPEVEIVGTPR